MGDRNVRNRVRRRRDNEEATTRRFMSNFRTESLAARAMREKEARLAQIAEEERLTREFLQNEGWNVDNFDREPDDSDGFDEFNDNVHELNNRVNESNEEHELGLDEDDDEINDDTLKGLWMYYRRRMSNYQILKIFLMIVIYILGQRHANKNGYGAVFFMISLFIFICLNLGKRRPGEWSAYSVFNPNFQSIMGVRGREHPEQEIIPF